jgi:hypothetical protein
MHLKIFRKKNFMKKIMILCLLGLSLGFLSAQKDTKKSEETPQEYAESHPYFPLAVENRWEFKGDDLSTTVFKVSHLDKKGFFNVIYFQEPSDEGQWITLKMNYQSDFVLLHERNDNVVQEDALGSYLVDKILPFETQIGNQWKYRPAEEYSVRQGEIVGIEDQKVPAGLFKDCIKVKLVREEMQLYFWFAKNVGWVHIRFVNLKDEIKADWMLSKYQVSHHISDIHKTPSAAFSRFKQAMSLGLFDQAYKCLSSEDQTRISLEEFVDKMQVSPMPRRMKDAEIHRIEIEGKQAKAVMLFGSKRRTLMENQKLLKE